MSAALARVCLAALLAAACVPPPISGSGPWTGVAAIALGQSFGSPVSFVCVVAWDLRYETTLKVADLRVDVRFPSAVQDVLVTTSPGGPPMTEPWPRYDEWRRWNTIVSGPASLGAMAERKHLVGTSGVPCRTQEATQVMRGTQLLLHWTTDGSEHDQLITVNSVANWIRSSGGSGEPRIEWLLLGTTSP
jgi:hypothetical protein